MKEIEGNNKNTDFVHIYKLDVVKNALKATIKILSLKRSIYSPLPNKLHEGLFGYISTVLVGKALKYSYF